jgi:hypothetical protein
MERNEKQKSGQEGQAEPVQHPNNPFKEPAPPEPEPDPQEEAAAEQQKKETLTERD